MKASQSGLVFDFESMIDLVSRQDGHDAEEIEEIRNSDH